MADFDTCKPGSSALYAALGRALLAELANYAGEFAGGMFHDWSNLSDTMTISILLTEALQTSYTQFICLKPSVVLHFCKIVEFIPSGLKSAQCAPGAI